MSDSIDITPNPRVLRMLGEIDFKAWQCLCEIIDNSIDAFVGDTEDEINSPSIKVKISAPSASRLTADDVLTVTDNARGMTREQLSKSLKAGFSGNDPMDKMGLFGMGFNISTARLGARTEVLTCTKDSDHFLRVTIDFQELERMGHFNVPLEVIPKKADERYKHGTTITVTKLRVEHLKPLFGIKRISDKLGKIYGRILRKKNIRISYQGRNCTPFQHCVWNEDRLGQSVNGPVHAVLQIDRLLDTKNYCSTCWVWLSDREHSCPACGEAGALFRRDRRVKGWIGIQRYFDKEHYGIDLIRNGRVIKELDKSFFYWNDEENDIEELEYPVDGHERKGRIVGELEIDFVKVTHQKDAFDTSTSDWRDVLRVVRGDGPIRPQIAKSRGYAENDLPLARLFSAFRKANAGVKNLVPAKSNGSAMITDPHLDELKRKFYEGITGYENDEKWWELLIQGGGRDSAGAANDDPTGGNPFENDATPEVDTGETHTVDPLDSEATSGPSDVSEPAESSRFEHDPSLSGVYSLPYFGNISIRVVAEKAMEGTQENGFEVRARGAELGFVYWPRSPIFLSTMLRPADFLINELAYQFHTTGNNELSRLPLSNIELAIREKYFPELNPNLSEVSRQVEQLVQELREQVANNLHKIQGFTYQILANDELVTIKKKLAQNEFLSEDEVMAALEKGEFLSYAPFSAIGKIVVAHPELLFDGVLFNIKWSRDNSGDQRNLTILRDLQHLIDEVLWFQENPGPSVKALWRGHVKRLIGNLEIASSWRNRSSDSSA